MQRRISSPEGYARFFAALRMTPHWLLARETCQARWRRGAYKGISVTSSDGKSTTASEGFSRAHQGARIEHQRAAFEVVAKGMAMPMTHQMPMAGVDGVPQRFRVIAVQEGHPAPSISSVPSCSWSVWAGSTMTSRRCATIVDVAGNKMGRKTGKCGNDVRADVAAMDDQAYLHAFENTNRLLHGRNVAVAIAEDADLHETIPGCWVPGGKPRGKRQGEGRINVEHYGQSTSLIGRNAPISLPFARWQHWPRGWRVGL